MSKTTSNMNTHMTTGGTQVPAERLNQWGFPSAEFYHHAGNGLWTEVNPNEKSATQIRKEKSANKKHAVDNADAIRYARGVTKDALYRQCLKRGLPVSGTKLQMATRILAFDNAPTTDGDYQCCSCEAFFNTPTDDDQCPHCFSGNWVEGAIDDPAKEESQ